MMSDYKNYAIAIFELAKEENVLDTVFEELTTVNNILKENPDYIKIISSTLLSKKQKAELSESAFSTLSELVRNFIGFMISKNVFCAFPECTDAFCKMYYKEKGIVTATVISATPLSEEEKAKFCDVLGQKEGKEVLLNTEIDSSLIGGAVLRFDGKEFDGSLKAKLSGIKAKLIEI